MEAATSAGIKILAFGFAAEKMKDNCTQAYGIADTDELKAWLFEHNPHLRGLPLRIAVNREIISSNTMLADGDEVALLPPFSGG